MIHNSHIVPNTIYNQDCMDLMQLMPDNSVSLLLTDIPYDAVTRNDNGLRNLDKAEADILTVDLHRVVQEMIRVTSGSGYIFCGWGQFSTIMQIVNDHKISSRAIIWEKTNPSPMNGGHIWLSGIEMAVYFKKPKATYNQHCKNVVVRFPSGRSKVHPTEKPLSLFKHLVAISSNENDIVFDPFLGSGTTAVAALELNRRYLGAELHPPYFAIAQNRIALAEQTKREAISASPLFE